MQVAKAKADECIRPFIWDAAFAAQSGESNAKQKSEKIMKDAEFKCKGLIDEADAIQAELDKLNGVKR